jgi:hypothetical protein
MIIGMAALAVVLTGCGIEGITNTGAWLPADEYGGEVWCVGNSSGGLSCNWDAYNRDKK